MITTNYTILHLCYLDVASRHYAAGRSSMGCRWTMIYPWHDVSIGAIQSREVKWCASSPALLMKHQYMSGYWFIIVAEILYCRVIVCAGLRAVSQ